MIVEFVTSYFKPYTGGIENVVEHLAEGLGKKGHTVVVHTSTTVPNSTEKLKPSEEYKYFLVKRYSIFPYSLFFPKMVAKESIISLHNYSALMNDYVAVRYQNHKMTLTPYGTITYDVSQRQHQVLAPLYDSVFGRRTLDRVDKIVAMTNFEKKLIARKYPHYLKKIAVVASGIDIPKKKLSSKKSFSYPYFLSVGRITHTKRFEDVLSILKYFPEYHYILAGRDIGYAETLQAAAKREGVKDRFHYLGQVDDVKKAELLSHCSAFVMPSSAEAFSIASLEAFYYTTNVVGAKSGGIVDLYSEFGGELFQTGDEIELRDAIQKCLSNRGDHRQLEQNRDKIVTKYSWSTVVGEYEKVISF